MTGAAGGNPAVAAVLADPLAIFEARSPGARGKGALFQTKRGYARSKSPIRAGRVPTPVERVLANVRTRPPLPVLPLLDIPNITGNDLVPAAQGEVPGAGFSEPGPTPGGGISLPPIAVGTTLPPGGGSGGGGGGGGGTTVPPGIPAVPEPATWLTMLAGFFVLGAALRRQTRRRAALTRIMPTR